MLSLDAKLKKLRISKGRSLQQVADAVGSSKSHIWQLETGKSKNPSFELLRNLADFFEVSIAYLVGETLEGDQENEDKLKEQNQQLRKSLINHVQINIQLTKDNNRLKDLLDQIKYILKDEFISSHVTVIRLCNIIFPKDLL